MKLRTALIVFALATIAGFAGAVVAYPRLLLAAASERLLAAEGAPNVFLHAPRVTELSRRVVRPAPDLVYSACVYDLADGPLRVTAPKPAGGRYASVSFYDAATNNFATFNDRDPEFEDGLIVTLVRPQDLQLTLPGYLADGDGWIESPSRTGIILLRRIVESDAAFATIDAERQAATCETINAIAP